VNSIIPLALVSDSSASSTSTTSSEVLSDLLG
jgi:hypothetical protein